MKKTIPVIGMACVVCAANVENTLRKLRGVNSATVTLSTRTVLVDYDPDVITLDDMKREVSKRRLRPRGGERPQRRGD